MARSDDDDALDWGDGSNDPTYVGSPVADRPRAGDAGTATEVGTGDDDPAAAADREGFQPDDARVAAAASGSTLLVVYGVFAGVYLLYVIGWIIGVQRDPFTSPSLFFEIMYQLGEFFAILSPVLWFGLTLLLTRRRTAVVRLVWLILGMIVVAPLPFLLGGGAA